MLISRKTTILLILAVLMITGGLFAQEVMRITRKDRTIIDIPTSEIDKITFHGGAPQVLDDQLRDADGNVYKTVRIGNQVWMAENLRTTKYADGSPIPEVRDNDAWKDNSNPAMCWPNNDKASYSKTYGALYNWEVVNTERLAPPGWRIPTREDFDELVEFAGAKNAFKLMTNQKGIWINDKGTNETGFTATSGNRKHDGGFSQFNTVSGYIWSSSINFASPNNAFGLGFNYGGHFGLNTFRRASGNYIRFIKE